MDNSIGYKGAQNPNSGSSEFNTLSFLIRQVLGQANHATLVRVVAVSAGAVGPVGFCDVTPLVQQIDGFGNIVASNTIHNVPYFRYQGGTSAVILDPKPDDIGIAIFADRDISSVKVARGAATPGSMRRNDMADALYVGGVLNGTPTQYVHFADDGIHTVTPGNFTVQAGGVFQVNATDIALTATDGSAQLTGNFNVNGEVTANGIPLSTHRHTGVQTGGGTSGGPTV